MPVHERLAGNHAQVARGRRLEEGVDGLRMHRAIDCRCRRPRAQAFVEEYFAGLIERQLRLGLAPEGDRATINGMPADEVAA